MTEATIVGHLPGYIIADGAVPPTEHIGHRGTIAKEYPRQPHCFSHQVEIDCECGQTFSINSQFIHRMCKYDYPFIDRYCTHKEAYWCDKHHVKHCSICDAEGRKGRVVLLPPEGEVFAYSSDETNPKYHKKRTVMVCRRCNEEFDLGGLHFCSDSPLRQKLKGDD